MHIPCVTLRTFHKSQSSVVVSRHHSSMAIVIFYVIPDDARNTKRLVGAPYHSLNGKQFYCFASLQLHQHLNVQCVISHSCWFWFSWFCMRNEFNAFVSPCRLNGWCAINWGGDNKMTPLSLWIFHPNDEDDTIALAIYWSISLMQSKYKSSCPLKLFLWPLLIDNWCRSNSGHIRFA